MANRFWVGGTGTWDTSTTTHWASTSGGGGGASAPTAADDVFIDTNSGGGTITLSAAVCRSLDCTGAPATTIAFASSTLAVGDGSGGAFKLVANITVTNTAGTLNFVSTSNNGGTGWAITTANKSLPTTNFNGAGGKWVLQDTSTWGSNTLTVTSGSFFGNGQTLSMATFNSSGAVARTVDITNCTITCSGSSGTPWTFNTTTNLTFTSTGSTITLTGSNANFRFANAGGNNGVINALVINGSGTSDVAISSGSSFTNFTRTGTAAKTDGLTTSLATTTVTGTLTLGGNTTQGVNRLLVSSSVLGTQRTWACSGATVVISGDVDFMDVNITGTPTWTNTGSKFVGDAGGNGALITTNMTTPATQTWNGDVSDNWSTTARWTSRVPLPQDDVVINQAFTGTKTITEDMPRFGKNIDFTGTTGNPRFTTGVNGATFYGSMKLVSGMTAPQGTSQWTAGGRGNFTITSSGVAWNNSFNFNGVGGTYTLQDAFTCNFTLTVNDGTWTTNDNAVTVFSFLAATSSRPITLNLGSSTITITQTTGGTVFTTNNSQTTMNGASATVVMSTASSSSRIVAWRGTLGTLTYTVANSPGAVQVHNAADSRTLTTLNVGSGRSVTIFAGSTITTNTFNVNGTANGYLYLPGVSGNYVSTPDSAALSITGDITVDCNMAMDDWTPAAQQSPMGKWEANKLSYEMRVSTAGRIEFLTSDNGSVFTKGFASSVSPTVSDGAFLWVRASLDVNDGAGNAVCRFYTSSDGSTWNQLGTTQTSAGATTIFDSTSILEIGSVTTGAGNMFFGKIGRVKIYSSDLQTSSGTPVFDADLTRNVSSSGWLDAAHTQFAESSSNAATVTINGSLAQAGDGRIILNSSTAGTRATLSKSSGIVSVNYLSIKDSAADGGASWHALSSADAGNNTGWIFGSTPSTSTNFLIFGGPQ